MKKYNINDLKKYISENKSTDEIGGIYNVSGRTVRNWFQKEGLETNVKFNGYKNVTSGKHQEKAIENSRNYFKNKKKKLVVCSCEICNKEYKVKESTFNTIGSRFCSNECKYEFLFKTKPENHPRWKGGISDKNQKERGSEKYKVWRLGVYKRDFYTCQKCGKIGKNLNAHHVENWADNEDLRYDINNGLTLCELCHNTFHRNYGYKTNRKQLNEFLERTNNGWKRSSLEKF